MKTKALLLIICFFTIGVISSQSKNAPKSIISTDATIKKYHVVDELREMQKGELITLYIERTKVVVETLQYIAFATKPGLTPADLGIPYDSDNKKAFETQTENTSDYLESTVDFQKKLLPYADKDNLIASILFFENTLKSLHEFEDLK